MFWTLNWVQLQFQKMSGMAGTVNCELSSSPTLRISIPICVSLVSLTTVSKKTYSPSLKNEKENADQLIILSQRILSWPTSQTSTSTAGTNSLPGQRSTQWNSPARPPPLARTKETEDVLLNVISQNSKFNGVDVIDQVTTQNWFTLFRLLFLNSKKRGLQTIPRLITWRSISSNLLEWAQCHLGA